MNSKILSDLLHIKGQVFPVHTWLIKVGKIKLCKLQYRTNIGNKVKKSNKSGQDWKAFKFTFAQLFTAGTKVLFLEGRMGTSLSLHSILR